MVGLLSGKHTTSAHGRTTHPPLPPTPPLQVERKNTASAWTWSCFTQNRLFHIGIFSNVPIYESRSLNRSSTSQGGSAPSEAMGRRPLRCGAPSAPPRCCHRFFQQERRSELRSRARSGQQPALLSPRQSHRRGRAATRGTRRVTPAALHGCRPRHRPYEPPRLLGSPAGSATRPPGPVLPPRAPHPGAPFPAARSPPVPPPRSRGLLLPAAHRGSALALRPPLPGPRTHRARSAGGAGPGRAGERSAAYMHDSAFSTS